MSNHGLVSFTRRMKLTCVLTLALLGATMPVHCDETARALPSLCQMRVRHIVQGAEFATTCRPSLKQRRVRRLQHRREPELCVEGTVPVRHPVEALRAHVLPLRVREAEANRVFVTRAARALRA